MRVNKKLARNLVGGAGCVLVLTVGVYFLVTHSLDNAFANADFTSLVVGSKAAVANVLVMRQPPKQLTSAQGFLGANQKESKNLPSDAKLLDVWILSAQIAESTLKATGAGSWVRSTESAVYLPAAQRHDPWNHCECVMRRGDTVAVISGGPSASSSPVCRNIGMTEDELAKLPHGRLIETPAGNFILVVHGTALRSGTPAS
jgi:hypothetical protein